MSIPQITSLLEFCLTNTYFLFQGKYCEQVQGTAMGSPISPLIANIFMEEFEVKALRFTPTPSLWLQFVDDTFVINRAEHSQDILHHINNQDPYIQFTVEPMQQGSLPFLDTVVTIEPDNTFSTTVYRKPTHTDQYLHWDSNHHITAKQSVYNILAHRAKIVSSTQDKMDSKLQHIRTALQQCQFCRLGPQPMATQIYQPQPAHYHHHHQQQEEQSTSQQQKEHHHCRTQPSTGTLGNTSYLTYGTTSFWCHQPYSASLPTFQLHPLPLTPHWFPPPSSHCPYW